MKKTHNKEEEKEWKILTLMECFILAFNEKKKKKDIVNKAKK